MSRALRLAASVQRAFPCPDPLVMTLAAKVFGQFSLLRLFREGTDLVLWDNSEIGRAGWVDDEWSCRCSNQELYRMATGSVFAVRQKSTIPLTTYDAKRGTNRSETICRCACITGAYESRSCARLRSCFGTTRQSLDRTTRRQGSSLALSRPHHTDMRIQVAIREAAADALSGCLIIATQRDGQSRLEAYNMVLEQAQRGFKLNTPEAIHGSLLGYKELFLEGKMVSPPFLFQRREVLMRCNSLCTSGTTISAIRFCSTRTIEIHSFDEQ